MPTVHENPGKPRFTAFEKRVVTRLSKGASITLKTGGHGRLGALTVPQSLIERLSQADLVSIEGDKAKLSAVGAKFAARLKASKEDKVDVFARQHQERAQAIKIIDNTKQKVTVNKAESPLYWLYARKDTSGQRHINHYQFLAGERLRQDWEMAQLGPRVCMSWSELPPERGTRGAPGTADLPPGALRAKERVDAALAACGPGLSDILVRICCYGEGLTDAEQALRWPRRSAKLILSFGLEHLVTFYGLRPGRG